MENSVVKKQRRPRKNYAADHEKLAMYLQISIGLLNGMLITSNDTSSISYHFNAGQLAALKAVQQQIGEAE